MPQIVDNIEQRMLEALQQTLKVSRRADFCVGYFNLRGWRAIDSLMEGWQGDEQGRCHLLIGMTERPEDELRKAFSMGESLFTAQYQCPVRSLTAFEKSEYPDDWRDLMRLCVLQTSCTYRKKDIYDRSHSI